MNNYRLLYRQPGSQTWKQLSITGQSFSIGRVPENNLVLDDVKVSRQHAILHLDDRGVWISDQNSSNGVLIDGQRIAAGEWKALPLNQDFTIGGTTLRVEAVAPAVAARPTARVQPARPAAANQPRQRNYLLPLVGITLVGICFCLVVGGVAAWFLAPRLFPGEQTKTNTAQPSKEITPGIKADSTAITHPTAQAEPTSGPPIAVDSLPVSAGGGPVQDDQGVSLLIPSEALEAGQQASLERANLSEGMLREIEASYQVESMLYAVRLPDGQDGTGRVELALPAKSPDSRLAVLVDDRWLGVLETPAQGGAFHISPGLALASDAQTYAQPTVTLEKAPNRYLVVTPKNSGSQQFPPGGEKLARLATQGDLDGKACVSEFWIANHCWRNSESSVYVFWESNVPANLKDQEYLRVVDTIKAVAAFMSSYQQKGFTGAAISPSNPAYIIIEAGDFEPYYSFKTGNVYVPWDIIGGIGDAKNRCTLAHEFFHWIEDEEYRMGVAALSGPKSWWLETSAENGAFLLDSSCIEKNLTQYGLVNTNSSVLGFQAAPLQWDGGEQARYVHALQLYLSICDGGNCALSQDAWIQAINAGIYPLEGGALTAYETNAKDLGRFLLGAAPAESRAGAVIPPSAISGKAYGDYLILKASGKSIWDYGLTMNQFAKASEQKIQVTANIEKGGVYPLWVSNGAGTPLGGGAGNTGLPGLLEIQAGPAFWLKRDQAEPVFYPAGTTLKLGPISDKLGVGLARMVAIAPDAAQTFQANLSLADFSGDWSTTLGALQVTPIDCPGYSESEGGQSGNADVLLQLFSGYGAYVIADPASSNLVWQGTLPEGMLGSSEVTVGVDKITLHYRLDMPQPTSGLLPGLMLNRDLAQKQAQRQSQWLALWPVLPALGLVAWKQRRRSKWIGGILGSLLVLMFGAFWMTGCLSLWGSLDVTYTFDKLEYVDPQQAAGSPEGQNGITWKLTNGQIVYAIDLTIESETTGADGATVKETAPCKLSATGSATGVIGPEGSVAPPDLGE
jgi:hypothetical protein